MLLCVVNRLLRSAAKFLELSNLFVVVSNAAVVVVVVVVVVVFPAK